MPTDKTLPLTAIQRTEIEENYRLAMWAAARARRLDRSLDESEALSIGQKALVDAVRLRGEHTLSTSVGYRVDDAVHARRLRSRHQPRTEPLDGRAARLADRRPNHEKAVDDRDQATAFMAKVHPIHAAILWDRLANGDSLRAIASRNGCSRQEISRILEKHMAFS